jgi:hypothetical protein
MLWLVPLLGKVFAKISTRVARLMTKVFIADGLRDVGKYPLPRHRLSSDNFIAVKILPGSPNQDDQRTKAKSPKI